MSEYQILQKKAATVLLGYLPQSSALTEALKILDLKPPSTRRVFHRCISIQRFLLGETDYNLSSIRNQVIHSQ